MPKTNGYDTAKAEDFLKRVENVEGQIESARGEFMAECKGYREDIKSILSEAEADGFDPKVLKIVLQERKLWKKIKDAPNGLDLDATAQYDALATALGAFQDTELGAAALAAARKENQASGSAAATDAQQPKEAKGGKKAKGEKKKPALSVVPGGAENTAKAN